MVLKTIGEVTGINFIPHESISGKVTVMSPTQIRLGDMYGFLQTILDVQGYAAIESENAIKIVPKADAAKHNTQVRIGADPAYIPRNDAIATQILPLRYASAAEISEIIKPFLSSVAQLATYSRTNSIMITDTSANIYHIAQIVQQLDVEGSGERVLTIPLVHASARVLSEQITRILEKADATTPQISRSRGIPTYGQAARALPDDRTNSVIAVGSEQDIETISKLVEQLDIERPMGTDNVHVTYLKNADANEVAAALEAALASMRISGAIEATQQIQITGHASTNSLIIVASAQDFEVISKIVDKLDIVREQVLVEMLIMEVTEEALKEIGVDWATLDGIVADSVRGFAMTNLGPRVDFVSGDLEGLAIGAWKGTDPTADIGVILHALEKQSGVNILSTPHIVTSNHRKARIIVGENRPFVTQSRITESASATTESQVIKGFEYKDVGITLEVTPHVSQGGLVRLEVDNEFTKLVEDVTTTSLDTPVTAKRSAQTVVSMRSGSTVIIGGLMRDDKTRIQQKVPLLGSLPLVGPLFRSQRDLLQKTNLLIFITPTVMASEEALLEMTNQKRQQMTDVQEKGG
ncbi:MAG: type II secretion system secretin GspD [Sedimentisphaerales bacterium]|nr:type II secretion system secretin GspD [Sedimentisphaerales bacterium]